MDSDGEQPATAHPPDDADGIDAPPSDRRPGPPSGRLAGERFGAAEGAPGLPPHQEHHGPPGRGQARRPAASDRHAGGEPRDDRRRRRETRESGDRKPFAGFEDGVERAYCGAAVHLIPETFPVVHRQGAATRRVLAVASRAGAVLLCDGIHSGPHRWPDGEEVAEAGLTLSSPSAPIRNPETGSAPETQSEIGAAEQAESTIVAPEGTPEDG